MCRVLSKHHAGIPAGAVYIGRGSKWGNPFRIGCDGDRAAVLDVDRHHARVRTVVGADDLEGPALLRDRGTNLT